MFDIGFSELLIIGVVALVVLGPERLPRAARTAGHLLGRLKRYVGDVKADISREMQLEELRKLQAQVEQQVREVERQVDETAASASDEVAGLSDQMRAAMAEQDRYAAVESALLDPPPPAVPTEDPVSGQLSLDIPPAALAEPEPAHREKT
jgi:sec-independent protein translocase protein TatB